MHRKLLKPFIGLGMIILIVSLACNLGPGAPEPTQVPPTNEPLQPPEQPTEKPVEPVEPVEEGPAAQTGLQNVENAVIQIEADGTFVDPEVGWQVNVGRLGSGFIIDPSGIAVTNNHVVTGAALLKVWVGGDQSKTYNAKVLGVSECSDLAVIDIQGDGFPYLDWYDGDINVGLKVYAAGYPLGDPNFTLTDGIVSKSQADGDSSWASVGSVIEHSAKINPGNSGGPLVDEQGRIVGINYATVAQFDQNFAIGRDEALGIIDDLRSGKDIDTIGVNGGAVSGTVSDVPISGIWVRSVASGSPADKALIQPGDIIYQMENLVLATDGTMADYCRILRSHHASDTLGLTIIRFSDLSLMEGQLNGRELAVVGYFLENPPAGDTGNETTTTGDYILVQDDTGTIQMDVPSAWSDVNGAVWESTWGNLSFRAPSISASTNLTDYYNYLAPGVFFTASDRLGEIGGFVQLLDGVRSWYESDCEIDKDLYRIDYGTGDWYDPYYEGKFEVWKNCQSTDTRVFILAARPKNDPTAFLILVEIRYITDADLDALFQILNTFEVIGNF
jgi:serine protease Do